MTAPRIVLYAILAAAAATLATLLLRSAPYGRHYRGGWGPCLRARTAWVVMELPAVIVIAVMAMRSAPRQETAAIVLVCAWELHYLYRTFVYPVLMRSSPRTFPVALVAVAWVFNTANGYVNGWQLFSTPAYTVDWLGDPRFLAGMLLFVAGFVIHVTSDRILRGLRAPGESAYRIPHGGLFELVSAPNYSGEMLQWIGWAVATWSLAGLSFALFTIANLLPRALSHHAWYLATFPDYPRARKAVIPFLL